MIKSIDAFARALDRALEDPDAVPDLLEAAASLRLDEGHAIATVQARIAAAIDFLDRNAAGGCRKDQQGQADRLDLIALSPGGIVHRAAEPGRSWIEQVLRSPVKLNEKLKLLEDKRVHEAFCRVRDGIVRAQWVNQPSAQICFAITNTKSANQGHLGVAPIVLMVKSAALRTSAKKERSQHPKQEQQAGAVSFALAKLFLRLDPLHPRNPIQWLAAAPPRKIFKLPDGRDLAYRIYGEAGAKAVLVFCAINTSTIADPYWANAAIRFGLKLIMIARPGLGLSTPLPKQSFQQVAKDVQNFAAGLELKAAAILGSGSGAYYAFAAARLLGPAVTRIGLYTPRLGPPQSDNQTGWGRVLRGLAHLRRFEQMNGLFMRMIQHREVAATLLRFSQTCERDKHLLLNEKMLEYQIAQTFDALGSSMLGGEAELNLMLSGAYEGPDGISQPIAIWYGSDNTAFAPSDLDRDFAGLRNVQIAPLPGAGLHFDDKEADRMMRWIAEGGEA